MKKLLFTIIAVMATISVFSQESSKDIIKAEYPGGEKAMMEFLSSSVKYPADAQEAKIQGRVFVQFVIEANGSITNATVLKHLSKSCDKEAIRVIESMPAWKPASKDGEKVSMKYVLPIIFKLDNTSEQKIIEIVNEYGDLKDEA